MTSSICCQDIINQSNNMAYLNVMSFSVLSGCGNIDLPDDNELHYVYKLLKNVEKSKMPANIFFMSSLYKRCIPLYAAKPESAYDFFSYLWGEKNRKRTILPEILSYSISCLCMLSEKVKRSEIVVDNPEFIRYLLITNAIKQMKFIVRHLKEGELYYPAKDVSDNLYSEIKLELDMENTSLMRQLSVLRCASDILSIPDLSNLCDKRCIDELNKTFELFPIVCENIYMTIDSIASRDLALICLDLIGFFKKGSSHLRDSYDMMNVVGLELTERVHRSGDIARNFNNDDNSSLVTLFNCLKCFTELYDLTGIVKYQNSSICVYDRIDSYWDPELCLFISTDKNKQKYSIKDIAQVLASLKTFRNNLYDPDMFMHVDGQLCSFFQAAFLDSRIINSQIYPILQGDKINLTKCNIKNKGYAPVFTKYFEIKISKRKYYCEADVFDPEYALYACRSVLE